MRRKTEREKRHQTQTSNGRSAKQGARHGPRQEREEERREEEDEEEERQERERRETRELMGGKKERAMERRSEELR